MLKTVKYAARKMNSAQLLSAHAKFLPYTFFSQEIPR